MTISNQEWDEDAFMKRGRTNPHELARVLLTLPETDRVECNTVGNLMIWRGDEYVGHVETRSWGVEVHWNDEGKASKIG